MQVPTIPGPLAQQNVRVYQRYAAVQQVLSLGHRCVSVQPELLLLSDPLPLLAHHPADVSVMSTAWGDESMAYGEGLGWGLWKVHRVQILEGPCGRPSQ